MGAKQSNPLYPSRALRADPSADDSSVGEDNLSGVVFSNERPEAHESKGGFFNLEHYLRRAAMTGVRSHERAPSSPTSDPSLPGSMRRTSVVQMDKINIFKARDGADVKVTICVKINKCVGCNATQLTESSVERPTPPRH